MRSRFINARLIQNYLAFCTKVSIVCLRVHTQRSVASAFGLERSRSHGRRYACLLVEAFSFTRLHSRCRSANVFGTMLHIWMLTIEPSSWLRPVEYRFKFQ